MKLFSTLSFLSLLIIIAFSSFKPQHKTRYQTEEEYDTINYNSMSISGVKLGSNYGSILDKLGSPDSVEKEETPDARLSNHFDVYHYGKDIFFVMDDTTSGFELNSTRFKIDNLGDLRVGDSMTKIKKRFPNSYKLRDIDNSVEEWITTISVQFGTSDSFLEITVKNDKIISLSTITDDGTDE
jgi:hypothetical protein